MYFVILTSSFFSEFQGSSGTSSTHGSGPCQNHSTSLTQAGGPTAASHTQKGKGTFTDDLHQLVDNWARDAISLSQGKKGPKTGPQSAPGHDVSIQPRFIGERINPYIFYVYVKRIEQNDL